MRSFIVGAVAVVSLLGLVACQAEDSQNPLPRVDTSEGTFASSRADDFRMYLEAVDMGYLADGSDDAEIDEAGELTCDFFEQLPLNDAVQVTVQAAEDAGLTNDEAISLVAALTLAYCPGVSSFGNTGYEAA